MKNLIIFPDHWPDKSQTFKNILKHHESKGEECIVLINGKFMLHKEYKSKFIFHSFNWLLPRLFKYIDRKLNLSLYCYAYSIYLLIKNWEIINTKFDNIIIFDYQALFFMRLLSSKKYIMVSLELPIYGYSNYLNKHSKILNLIFTQSNDRYYLLNLKNEINHKLIFNSTNLIIGVKPKINDLKIIHCGTLNSRSGLNFILEIAEQGYQIDLIGGETVEMISSEKYQKLKSLQKIHLIDKFYSDEELMNVLSKYKIGLAFYDIYTCTKDEFSIIDTSPSGKVLLYAASLVPVISNNISSNYLIKDYKSGELIKNFVIDDFNVAFNKICENYDEYLSGCNKLANFTKFSNKYFI